MRDREGEYQSQKQAMLERVAALPPKTFLEPRVRAAQRRAAELAAAATRKRAGAAA